MAAAAAAADAYGVCKLQFVLDYTLIHAIILLITAWLLLCCVQAAAPKLEPADVEALVPALHAVGRYDRELFAQFADIVKVRRGQQQWPLAAVLQLWQLEVHNMPATCNAGKFGADLVRSLECV
jgi:hypothetical protein